MSYCWVFVQSTAWNDLEYFLLLKEEGVYYTSWSIIRDPLASPQVRVPKEFRAPGAPRGPRWKIWCSRAPFVQNQHFFLRSRKTQRKALGFRLHVRNYFGDPGLQGAPPLPPLGLCYFSIVITVHSYHLYSCMERNALVYENNAMCRDQPAYWSLNNLPSNLLIRIQSIIESPIPNQHT